MKTFILSFAVILLSILLTLQVDAGGPYLCRDVPNGDFDNCTEYNRNEEDYHVCDFVCDVGYYSEDLTADCIYGGFVHGSNPICSEIFGVSYKMTAQEGDASFKLGKQLSSRALRHFADWQMTVKTPAGTQAAVETKNNSAGWEFYYRIPHALTIADAGVYTFTTSVTENSGINYNWTSVTTLTVRGSYCSNFQIANANVHCSDDKELQQTSCYIFCKDGFTANGTTFVKCLHQNRTGNGANLGYWKNLPDCHKNRLGYHKKGTNIGLGLLLGILTTFNAVTIMYLCGVCKNS